MCGQQCLLPLSRMLSTLRVVFINIYIERGHSVFICRKGVTVDHL